MQCPACGHDRSRVIDTRAFSSTVRRVRECPRCGRIYRTWEEMERDQDPAPDPSCLHGPCRLPRPGASGVS